MNIVSMTLKSARRLAVAAQHLSGPPTGMLDTIRALGCLQLDPTSIVAKNHLLVLYSRLGAYDRAEFDRLMWGERQLFEYWAHAASIVLTENYPIHARQMRAHAESTSGWGLRLRDWADANADLRQHILASLRERGPLTLSEIGGKDKIGMTWVSGGWTTERTAARMLDYLWLNGDVLVHSRRAQNRLWHLAEAVLPDWTPHAALTPEESTRRSVEISLRALGAATPAQIKVHFVRGAYAGLPAVLHDLEAEGVIVKARVEAEGRPLPGVWYIHRDALPLLASVEGDDWGPRTTLLSPFDNLICDRKRTELLWDFYFRLEIYTPRHKRQYGYFVMPVLHGECLVARIDPAFDRKSGRLHIHALHWQPDAERGRALEAAVSGSIEALARWLGATDIVMPQASA